MPDDELAARRRAYIETLHADLERLGISRALTRGKAVGELIELRQAGVRLMMERRDRAAA